MSAPCGTSCALLGGATSSYHRIITHPLFGCAASLFTPLTKDLPVIEGRHFRRLGAHPSLLSTSNELRLALRIKRTFISSRSQAPFRRAEVPPPPESLHIHRRRPSRRPFTRTREAAIKNYLSSSSTNKAFPTRPPCSPVSLT